MIKGLHSLIAETLAGHKVYIFCAGVQGRCLAKEFMSYGLNVSGFIDNDKKLNGQLVEGNYVYAIDDLAELGNLQNKVYIIIASMNQKFCDEISKQLNDMGLQLGTDYLVWKDFINMKLPLYDIDNSILDYYKEMGKPTAQLADQTFSTHMLGKTRFYNAYDEMLLLYKQFILPGLDLENDSIMKDLVFNLIGTNDGEAIYIQHYLHNILKADLEGDVCEFGIAQGATSALLANMIRNTTKNLWLFDSFEGLSIPTQKDELKDDIFHLGTMQNYAFTMKCSMNEVKDRLNQIAISQDRVKIVPGFIENTIKNNHLPDKVSFAYVDFDLYEPILIALNYLHKVLTVGGAIIVDDYDFFSTGAKTAVDEFVQNHQKQYIFTVPLELSGHFCILERVSES